MADRDHLNDLSCDDVTDAQDSDSSVSDNDSQSATYPQHGGLRPAGGLPAFVPFAAWKPARSYQNTQTLRYNVEWKLFVKNRERAGQSELDIVLSPREFWKHVLRPKLKEESEDKPWKAAAALFVLSVNDRRTKSIKKRYQSQSKIEWPFLAQTLQEWSKSLGNEKIFSIEAKFYYEQSASQDAAAKAGRGASNQQRAVLGAAISEEIAYMGKPAAIRTAYATMRCSEPPCMSKGATHCWVYNTKHYRLWPHHIRMLADHLQSGGILHGHDNVPDTFKERLLEEERNWEERERKKKERKRKRRDSGDSLTIVPCQLGHDGSGAPVTPDMVFPTSPLYTFDMPSEDTVAAYSVYQRSQYKGDEQKSYIDLVQDMTVVNGYTLDMIACNQGKMCRFYEKHGIPQGIAWNYVCKIPWFVKMQARSRNMG
ncbi:hypothetical protein BB8028_0012g00190 [Beauveria bassiana]|uniref:Uncharacterized protein n=1 Tax=Beauveria bassiana TaxID=176275 RepID=A0A2S7YQM2_BEABA|nr:hypothetical protein BB8028_0012g00190 [Beauveria bassiana]